MVLEQRVYGRAIRLAYYAHDGVFDENGVAYFYHPARVARYVAESGGDYEAKTIAILHDVAEDCEYSIMDLRVIIGISVRVADALELLTRREDESYEEFIDRIAKSGNMDAVLVKLCDLKDNLDPNRVLPDAKKAARLKARYLKAKSVLEDVYFGV